MRLLTQKEHADRLRISQRTFRRRVVEFQLLPEDLAGQEPRYSVEAVNAMEGRRQARLLARSGRTGGIVSVREAKRRAGKGVAK